MGGLTDTVSLFLGSGAAAGLAGNAAYDGLRRLSKWARTDGKLGRLGLGLAVGLLPLRDRDRYAEEWLAELDGRTGLKALPSAWGFIRAAAARRMRTPIHIRQHVHLADRITSEEPERIRLIRGVTLLRTATACELVAVYHGPSSQVHHPGYVVVEGPWGMSVEPAPTMHLHRDGWISFLGRPQRLNWRLTVEAAVVWVRSEDATSPVQTGESSRCTTRYAVARWRPILRRRLRQLGVLAEQSTDALTVPRDAVLRGRQ